MMRTPKTGVWLIRHPKTKLNSNTASQDFIRGWQNVPIDEEGKKEAQSLVSFLTNSVRPVAIFSSDLDRASEPAQQAAQALRVPVQASAGFRPWGLGVFQGQPAEKVVPQLQEYIDRPNVPVPQGESFNQFRTRVLNAIRQPMEVHQATGENVAVITHFRDLKLLEAWLKKGGDDTHDIDAETFAANDIPTGGMDRLYRDRGQWHMTREQAPKVGVRTGPMDNE